MPIPKRSDLGLLAGNRPRMLSEPRGGWSAEPVQ